MYKQIYTYFNSKSLSVDFEVKNIPMFRFETNWWEMQQQEEEGIDDDNVDNEFILGIIICWWILLRRYCLEEEEEQGSEITRPIILTFYQFNDG